jgi:hypothetical protein
MCSRSVMVIPSRLPCCIAIGVVLEVVASEFLLSAQGPDDVRYLGDLDRTSPRIEDIQPLVRAFVVTPDLGVDAHRCAFVLDNLLATDLGRESMVDSPRLPPLNAFVMAEPGQVKRLEQVAVPQPAGLLAA